MNRIKFPNRSHFQTDLNTQVDLYFENTQLPKTGTWRMFFKTGVIICSVIAFYMGLVFYANTYWTVGLFVSFVKKMASHIMPIQQLERPLRPISNFFTKWHKNLKRPQNIRQKPRPYTDE